MAVDPRLEAVRAATGDPYARLTQRLLDLEREVSRLRAGSTKRTFSGPAQPTAQTPDGALYVQTLAPTLWVRCGGAWRSVALS